jgi:hypothetical protein
VNQATPRRSAGRRLIRAALLSAGVLALALALGRLGASQEADTPSSPAGLVALQPDAQAPARETRMLLSHARRAALAYAQADPRSPGATLDRLRALARPALVARIRELLAQARHEHGPLPAPRARVLQARLAAITPRTARVLVALVRRHGRLRTRWLLLVELDRPTARVRALASV